RPAVRPVVEGDLERAALVRPVLVGFPHIRVGAADWIELEAAAAWIACVDGVAGTAAAARVLHRERRPEDHAEPEVAREVELHGHALTGLGDVLRRRVV